MDSADINEYIQRGTGGDFSAKDFRTWAGTVEALRVLYAEAAAGRRGKRVVNAAIAEVAARLGNTRAVCRRYYIHPLVIERFEAGGLQPALDAAAVAVAPKGLRRPEALAYAFLRRELEER